MAKKQPAEGQSDQAFIECIDRLREEVQVLHNVVDELREELQYLVCNPGERNAETVDRLRVTSLPLDPAADNFGERVNAVPEETVTELRTAGETTQ